MSAAAPETCGADIEVPSRLVLPPPSAVDEISTPGAVISGLISNVLGFGPRDDRLLSTSFLSVFPTVRASRAVPGERIVLAEEPELPAATTTITPALTASSTA